MPAAGAESVRVAAGAADAAVAVWRSGDGEHGSIAASRFDGGSWSEPVPISGGPGSADLADVAMSGDTAVAVWRQENAGGEAPAAAVSSEGGDWSEPAPLADPVGHLGAPVVAAGGGTTVAAWSADGEIMVSACPDEGDFATAGSIGAAVGSDDPRVAVGVDGRAILTWSQPDAESDTVRVMGASRSVVGTWSAPEMLSTFLPRLAVSERLPPRPAVVASQSGGRDPARPRTCSSLIAGPEREQQADAHRVPPRDLVRTGIYTAPRERGSDPSHASGRRRWPRWPRWRWPTRRSSRPVLRRRLRRSLRRRR